MDWRYPLKWFRWYCSLLYSASPGHEPVRRVGPATQPSRWRLIETPEGLSAEGETQFEAVRRLVVGLSWRKGCHASGTIEGLVVNGKAWPVLFSRVQGVYLATVSWEAVAPKAAKPGEVGYAWADRQPYGGGPPPQDFAG